MVKPLVVITVEGGLIQDITTTLPISVVVIDKDTMESDPGMLDLDPTEHEGEPLSTAALLESAKADLAEALKATEPVHRPGCDTFI